MGDIGNSVIDYVTADSLETRLRLGTHADLQRTKTSQGQRECRLDDFESDISTSTTTTHYPDWYIPEVDIKTSQTQTIGKELKRLLALKSYQVVSSLDKKDREYSLDRMATLAKNIFNTNMSFISIIDLGRCLFLAKDGIDLVEVPRRGTFCSHALLASNDFYEVRDAQEHPIFKNYPMVQAGLVRFYAAYPLVCPEGFKLGLFTVVDSTPRADGLSEKEIKSLKSLAQGAMDDLVRYRELTRTREQLEETARVNATLSHDLLTPLMVVDLSLSFLQNDPNILHHLSPEQLEYLKSATNCVEAMKHTCGTYRSSYNSNTRKRHTGENLIDMNKMCERLIVVARCLVDVSDVKCTVDAKASCVELEDETVIFRPCLYTLNAFCPKTRSIPIRLKFELCNRTSGEHELFVQCSRSGEPLSKMERDNFLRAFSLEMDGSIQCGFSSLESKVQESLRTHETRFWFRLRLKTKTSDTSMPHQLKEKSAKILHSSTQLTPKIFKKALVVEDSPVVRKMFVRALQNFGMEVSYASNGDEGLKMLQNRLYDIAFIDFLMPVCDGWDCCRLFREWESEYRPGTHQVIVGMSAHASRKDIERSIELGMDDFVSKPVSINDLGRIITAHTQPSPTCEIGRAHV